MAKNEAAIKEIRAGRFRENNGDVLTNINLLRIKHVPLRDLRYVLKKLSEGEIVDSVNFLQLAGYIELRHMVSKDVTRLADSEFDELEGLATAKGIRLLNGGIKDDEVVFAWQV